MLSRLSKPRRSQIPFRMAVNTYVVWPRGDQVARDLINLAHPEFLLGMYVYCPSDLLIDEKSGVQFPIEPEPLVIAENNLILLGGDGANPYTKKYFTDTGIITYDPDTETMKGPGVYANGKRCITSVKRTNGTVVTGVWGVKAADTLYAVQDYLAGPLGGVLALVPYGIAFAAGLAVAQVW